MKWFKINKQESICFENGRPTCASQEISGREDLDGTDEEFMTSIRLALHAAGWIVKVGRPQLGRSEGGFHDSCLYSTAPMKMAKKCVFHRHYD